MRAETPGDGSHVQEMNKPGTTLLPGFPRSQFTHPLALWSSWAWNPNWSWSTLGRRKKAEVRGQLLESPEDPAQDLKMCKA